MKLLNKSIIGMVLLLCWWSALPVLADDYNPANPAEPYQQYKITVAVTPSGAGTASTSGKFKAGTSVTMNTSACSTNWKFQYWTLNGVQYSTQKTFPYTVTATDAAFVAVYVYEEPTVDPGGSGSGGEGGGESGGGTIVVYDPTNPAEPYEYFPPKPEDPGSGSTTPEPQKVFYTLNFSSNIPAACSFNITNGLSVEADTYVKLECYGNQGYDFVGWYNGGTLLGTTTSINYQMTANATLEARWKVYSPDSPDDPTAPEGGNTAKYLLGDINHDNVVNVADAVAAINIYLSNSDADLSVADVNSDGVVNVADAVAIINIYLQIQ